MLVVHLTSIALILLRMISMFLFFFFFNDTATTEIYTLSLHDALPISFADIVQRSEWDSYASRVENNTTGVGIDRKSTRLNSSHGYISYAVFCLKKKKRTSLVMFIVLCVQLLKYFLKAPWMLILLQSML